MPKPIMLCAAALLASGCVVADIGEGDEAGLEDVEFAADNGIFLDNGLDLPNGMNLGNGTSLANGMNLGNGIDLANGMNLGNGIYAPPAGSGLEQWIDVDPAMRKKIMRYLVECALPAGFQVDLTYRGRSEILGSGIAGLGPSLQTGIMNDIDQQRVSACMLARMNGLGVTVQIDMFGAMGPDAPAFQSAGPGDDAFPVREAAFYGNLFIPEHPAYACTDLPYTPGDWRSCKDTGGGTYSCGVIEPEQVHCGAYFEDASTQYLQCVIGWTTGSAREYFTSCMGGELVWKYVLTTYIALKPDGGACFSSDECASGTCGGNVCITSPLANGEQCSWASECASGICSGGVCGLPAGARCYANDQCASDTCSLKRKVCL
jgi:hypothetical protein